MSETRERFVAAVLGISVLSGLFFYASFFRAVMSTTAEWTGSGFVFPIQEFHNFIHGRPFQSSLCATPAGGGSSVGFIANPYAFISSHVIHVYWLPYLFAPLWGLHQTPASLYGIQALWCLLISGFFTFSILRRLDPNNWRAKGAFALAILISGGLLMIIAAMGQFLVFAGPLMLAVYDAALSRRKSAYLFWLAALCFVSEDAAMVAFMLSLYFVMFEPDHRRVGLLGAGLSLLYLGLILGVVQPASRAELTVINSTTTMLVLSHAFQLSMTTLVRNLFSLLPVLTLIPALGMAASLFGNPARAGWLRLAAVALVPALPHWGESILLGGGHHLFPPFFGVYLALLLLLGGGAAVEIRRWPALGWALAFGLISLRAQVSLFPPEIKLPLMRRFRPAQAEALSVSLLRERESNLAVIAAARSIPIEDSLCFLGNVRPSGYIYARSDIWEFPDYYRDTRYLLIQKDAIDANSGGFSPKEGETLESVVPRIRHGQPREFALTPAAWMLVRRTLVDQERTHRVVREDEHVLLFENLHPNTPVSAPSTYGWGWVKNIGRRPNRSLAAPAN